MFCKKGLLRNFTKFTGKHLRQSFIFNKVTGLRYAILLKKRLWRRCFLLNFVKFLRTPIFIEHLWWLLIWLYYLNLKNLPVNGYRSVTLFTNSFLYQLTHICWKISEPCRNFLLFFRKIQISNVIRTVNKQFWTYSLRSKAHLIVVLFY